MKTEQNGKLELKLTGSQSVVLEVISLLEKRFRIVEVSRFRQNVGAPGIHVYVTIEEVSPR